MTTSLCPRCRWVRRIETPRGSRFLLCERSKVEPGYPKYPPQPVARCGGFEPEVAAGAEDVEA